MGSSTSVIRDASRRPVGRVRLTLAILASLYGHVLADEAPSAGSLRAAVAPLVASRRDQLPVPSELFAAELARGLAAAEEGKPAQAAVALAAACREAPLHPAPRLALAVVLASLERLAPAERELSRALSLAEVGELAGARLDLSRALGSARASVVRALAVGTDHPLLAAGFAHLTGSPVDLEMARAFDAARGPDDPRRGVLARLVAPADDAPPGGTIDTGAQEDGGPADVFLRGAIAFHAGRYDDAALAFSAAYARCPSFVRAAFFDVHAQLALGRHELASAELARLLAHHPGWLGQHVALRDYYADPAAFDRQLDALKAALRAAPSPELLLLLGYALYADGDHAGARAVLTSLAESLGDDRAALRATCRAAIVWCERQIRGEVPRGTSIVPRFDSAKPAVPPAAGSGSGAGSPSAPESTPALEDSLENAALALRQGDRDGALRAAELAVRAADPAGTAWRMMAAVRFARGEWELAGGALRRGLASAPDPGEVVLDWVRHFSGEAAYAARLADLERGLETTPRTVDAMFLAGVLHCERNGYARALALFKAVLTAGGKDDPLARSFIDVITRRVEGR